MRLVYKLSNLGNCQWEWSSPFCPLFKCTNVSFYRRFFYWGRILCTSLNCTISGLCLCRWYLPVKIFIIILLLITALKMTKVCNLMMPFNL